MVRLLKVLEALAALDNVAIREAALDLVVKTGDVLFRFRPLRSQPPGRLVVQPRQDPPLVRDPGLSRTVGKGDAGSLVDRPRQDRLGTAAAAAGDRQPIRVDVG